MTMTFGDALIYSLLGLGVVFFALALLMVIVKLITSFGKEKPAETVPQPQSAAELKPAPGAAGELKLYDTDPRTAAMLMAIVADELQLPINELRFISIREIKEDNGK